MKHVVSTMKMGPSFSIHMKDKFENLKRTRSKSFQTNYLEDYVPGPGKYFVGEGKIDPSDKEMIKMKRGQANLIKRFMNCNRN